MDSKRCAYCDGPLNLPRRGSKFCTPKCGTYFRRSPRVPSAMLSQDRWVRRGADKRPLTVAGRAASSTDSRTWASFKDASKSDAGVGLGFVLNGDGVGVIDLDDCFSDGELAEWAAAIVDANAGTFTELSQSGRGLHIWGLLPSGPGRRIRDGRQIEIYSSGRYMAMGTPIPGTSMELLPLNI